MAVEDERIPTRDTCDLTNPEETFLWCFVGMAHVVGAMLAFPLKWWRKVSAHLVRCGAMLTCPQCGYSKQPEVRFQLPVGDAMLGAAGRWVPADSPEADDPLGEQLAKVAPDVLRQTVRRVQAEHPEWFDEEDQ